MNRFYQLLLYFHILVVLLQNVWLNIVFYDAVADYGRKYMEYGIENGTVGKAWAWYGVILYYSFTLCWLYTLYIDAKCI